MHLGDLLREEISNYEDERRRLEVLFSEQVFSESIYPYTRYTVQSYIADDFMKSHFRGTSISVEDFLGQCEREWRTPSLKGLLFYCEVLLNLLTLIDMRHGSLRQAMALKNLIVENINIILDKTGYFHKKGKDGLIRIIIKNALASAVIEDLSDKDVAMAVLSYNRLDAQGDVASKRKTLFAIGKYIEPIIQRYKDFEGLKYDVADDVRFGLNNLDIRHNNKRGRSANQLIKKMTNKELEAAYDDLYRSMLVLIELENYPEAHDRIKQLRKNINVG